MHRPDCKSVPERAGGAEEIWTKGKPAGCCVVIQDNETMQLHTLCLIYLVSLLLFVFVKHSIYLSSGFISYFLVCFFFALA